MTGVERNSMVSLLYLTFIAVGVPLIQGENIASAFVSDETFDEKSPPQILLSVSLGEGVVDLNLNQSKDQVSDFPVFQINNGGSGHVSLRKVPIQKQRTLYQDQDQEAAFLRSVYTDQAGTTHVTWEGLVHSKGLVYQLTSSPSARASPSGRAMGRSSDTQASTRAHIPFNVQSFHPSDIMDKLTDDFRVPDGRANIPRTETQSDGSGGRQKRQTSDTQNVYVDIVAFADYGVYSAWYERSTGTTDADKQADAVEQMTQHYAFLFNGVDLMYKNIPRSYVNITVRLVSLLYAATPNDSSITETLRESVPGERHDWVNGYTTLDRVEIWVRNNSAVLPAHDHFMYFIGYDITNGTTNHLLGRAYIGTACKTDGFQTSITEDIGDLPKSLLVAAHELGHSLSAYHDGRGPTGGVANSCLNSDRFIMSSSPDLTKLNAWIFSNCSAQYFSDFIGQQAETASGRQCVYQMLPVNSTIPDVTGRLPGQVYNVHDQCQQIYGNSSLLCTGVTTLANNKSEVCRYLSCKINTTTCRAKVAARGTTCGNQMWCIDGRCVYDRSAPQVLNDCVFGDRPGPVYNDIDDDCAQVVGRSNAKCYQTYVFNRCCSTCNALYRPVLGCEFGDRRTGCSAADCSFPSRLSDCCQTCDHGTPITTTTTTPPPRTSTTPTTTTTTTTPPPTTTTTPPTTTTTTTTTTSPPPTTTTTTTTTPPPTTTTTTATTTTPPPTTTTTPESTSVTTTSDGPSTEKSKVAPLQASQAACVISTIVALILALKPCSSSLI